MGGIGGSRHGVGSIGSSRSRSISSGRGSGISSVGSVARVDGSSVACVRGVVGDARGVSGNWGSSSVDIASSNSSRSDRSSRRNGHRGSRGNSNWGSSSDRSSSRDDQQVGSGGVTVGDGLVLSSDCLRSKRAAVAHTVAIPESSGVPARLGLAVPVFGAARGRSRASQGPLHGQSPERRGSAASLASAGTEESCVAACCGEEDNSNSGPHGWTTVGL